MSQPNPLRILVANDAQAIREVLGRAVELVCPGASIATVADADLIVTISTEHPDLLICSEMLSAAVRTELFAWILINPEEEDVAVVSIDQRQSLLPGAAMDSVIGVVQDVAMRLNRDNPSPPVDVHPGRREPLDIPLPQFHDIVLESEEHSL